MQYHSLGSYGPTTLPIFLVCLFVCLFVVAGAEDPRLWDHKEPKDCWNWHILVMNVELPKFLLPSIFTEKWLQSILAIYFTNEIFIPKKLEGHILITLNTDKYKVNENLTKIWKFHHQLASHHREALLLKTSCYRTWTTEQFSSGKGKEESGLRAKLDPSPHGILVSLLVSKGFCLLDAIYFLEVWTR